MDKKLQNTLELDAVLNLVPYLDINLNVDYDNPITLKKLVNDPLYQEKLKDNASYQALKKAVDANPSYAKVELIDQSSTNESHKWKDDLIQGCTFRDADGNYHVAYRGTGDGRWADNGAGMSEKSTVMQDAAQQYFDEVAEKYDFESAHAAGKKIYVTGHSKGGNEAQYVYMTSKYEYLIDGCYSYDGQGFSKKAVESFIATYGYEEYQRKLSKMYSINGHDDPVHELGITIIPEENTYYVKSSGTDIKSIHTLENMFTDDNGNYTGLNWFIKDGKITHGEQGDIGKLAKKYSQIMMSMDEDDIYGMSVAVMTAIDTLQGHDILGDKKADTSDNVDLLANGLPTLLATLLFTKEGNTILVNMIKDKLEKDYKEKGIYGVVSTIAFGVVGLAFLGATLNLVIKAAMIWDLYIEAFELMQNVNDVLRTCVHELKEWVINAACSVVRKVYSLTPGYHYATNNPQIKLDTYKLRMYADRLNTVNSRVCSLDGRLDSLYGQVGLQDIWNLMQADLFTGYSWRVLRCAEYLYSTADDFDSVESSLQSNL